MAGGGLVTVAATALWSLAGGISGYPAEVEDWLVSVLALLLAARVISHVPRNATGWVLLAAGSCAAVTVATTVPSGMPASWLRLWLWWPTLGLLTMTLLLFPDGRPPTSRWRVAVVVTAAGTLLGTVGLAAMTWRDPQALLAAVPASPGWDVWATRVGGFLLCAGLVAAVASTIIRVRRAPRGRRGTLSLSAGAALLFVLGWILSVANVSLAGSLLALVIPGAIVLAVTRHGLYDIDLILHRSLLSGLLTLVLTGLYTVVVAVAAIVVHGAAPIVASVVVVITVLPLHSRLQPLIERWLFGQRSQPYDLVSSLARGIGTALTPAELLGSVVRQVGEGLKLPFVAIRLGERAELEQQFGRRRAWAVTALALDHRGETIGELLVQQRAPDEPWSQRERTLLADLARQVAPSAAAVRLTRDLQAARERLVTTREEERRRLRTDLHDGVGPALAGARMQVRAVLGRGTSPDMAATLAALADDLSLASSEVRRVIDGLRPPALDRGLEEALRYCVRRYDRLEGVDVTWHRQGSLEELPAAVEVALYRVLDEALNNAVRHGRPSTVAVELTRSEGWIELTVADDGTGLPAPTDEGVGLTSMRERCEELGGRFEIRATRPGTEVRAAFPLRG